LVGFSALTATILMASGCGGSSSSSDDADSTVVSRGLITGFGSVYVNGIRFHTGGTTFSGSSPSKARKAMMESMVTQLIFPMTTN
jgi:hypothetical protein